jgi:hypothetical protein
MNNPLLNCFVASLSIEKMEFATKPFIDLRQDFKKLLLPSG